MQRVRVFGFPCNIIGLLVAAVWLVVSTGCASNRASAPTETIAETSVARQAELQSTLLLTGELKAIEADPIIVPRTPTWQMPIRWMESDGAVVSQGQKVLELDNAQFSGELEEKRLAEARALNQLMQKEADIAVELADKRFAVAQTGIQLERARLEAEIPQELRALREHQEKQLAFTKAQSDHAKAEEDLAATERASEAELDELRIALEKARSDVRTAEQAIEALVLRAPRDGILVVGEHPGEGRKFQVGDNVWVGLSVMEIPELSAMKVEALLSDVDDGRMAVGDAASCVLDTYPDRTFTGTVVEITPVAKELGTRSRRRAFNVTIRLDDADPERMRPGMSVRAEVVTKPVDGLVVPRAALVVEDDAVLARLADGTTTAVEPGPCNAQSCIIESGLEPGARLRLGS